MASNVNALHREPWNKGKIVGQKAPFKVKDIWALRVRLTMESRVRELALFNLGIDSKLRGCDLVSLKVRTERKFNRTDRSISAWVVWVNQQIPADSCGKRAVVVLAMAVTAGRSGSSLVPGHCMPRTPRCWTWMPASTHWMPPRSICA